MVINTNKLIKKAFKKAERALFSALIFNVILSLTFSPIAFSLPSDYSVESGDVSFDLTSENTLTITASDNAIINFGSFSIGENEFVYFVQPGAGSSVLGRVVGSSSSELFGGLYANGQFLLVNTNGIHFGASADIQVGSLIASTLDIQSAMYLNNQYVFENPEGTLPAGIFNEANITVTDGGYLVLLSNSIQNSGVLTANLGSVVLGTGEKQTLSFDQNGLINLVIDRGVANELVDSGALIHNTGSLVANGGKVLLTAKTLNDTFDLVINNEGLIEASQAVERDGMVELVSNGGIRSHGVLRSAYLHEEGASFDIGGVFHAGDSYIRNRDGAITYSANTSVSGTITDLDNIIINAGVQLSLTADTWLKADSDNDGSGTFTMGAGSSVAGNGYQLHLSGSGSATIASVQNVSALVLDHSNNGGVVAYTMLQNLSLGSGNLAILVPGVSLNMGAYSLTSASLTGSGAISGTGTWVITGIISFNAGSVLSAPSSLTAGGTVSLTGTFIHNSGTVILNGSGQNILGSTTFYNLTKNVTSADTLTFLEGTTQTIEGTLTLQGTAGNLLSLRSSNPGTQWNINPQATRVLSYLDVQDSNNTNNTAMNAAQTGSINSGNNTNWTFVNPTPVAAPSEAIAEVAAANETSSFEDSNVSQVVPAGSDPLSTPESPVAVVSPLAQQAGNGTNATLLEELSEFLDENSSDMAVSEDGTVAYISNSVDDTIKVVDLKTKTLIGSFSAGTGPSSMLLTHDGKSMFVFNRLDQSISRMDPFTGLEQATLTLASPGDKPGIPATDEYVQLLMNDALMNSFTKESQFPAASTTTDGQVVFYMDKATQSVMLVDSKTGKTEGVVTIGPIEAASTGFPPTNHYIQLLMNDGMMAEFLK